MHTLPATTASTGHLDGGPLGKRSEGRAQHTYCLRSCPQVDKNDKQPTRGSLAGHAQDRSLRMRASRVAQLSPRIFAASRSSQKKTVHHPSMVWAKNGF